MAKKAVATFNAKSGERKMTKCIKMEKSPKTGAYTFDEMLVDSEKAADFFRKK